MTAISQMHSFAKDGINRNIIKLTWGWQLPEVWYMTSITKFAGNEYMDCGRAVMFVKFAEHPPVGVRYRIKTLVCGYVKSLENIDSVKSLNIRRIKSQHLKKIIVLSCGCLCRIPWRQMLSRECRCSWSSADRRRSNYIWGIENFIAY